MILEVVRVHWGVLRSIQGGLCQEGRGLLKGRHSAAASWDANTVFLVVGISCNSKGSESRLRTEGLLHSQAVKDSAAVGPHGLSSLVTVTIGKGDCCFPSAAPRPRCSVAGTGEWFGISRIL